MTGRFEVEGAEEVSVRLLLDGIAAACGKVRANGLKATFSLTVENPKLWWPNGYGEQPLYTLELTARGENGETDLRRVRIGIRDLKFVKNETEDETARPIQPASTAGGST